MKKLMIVALLILSIGANGKEKQSTTEQVVSTVSNVIDSTKKAVSETTDMIDTSSNFRRIYGDVKSGIGALSSSLKVGAEHVYGVLVKQQIVNSIVWIILLVISIVAVYIFYRLLKHTTDNWKKIYNEDKEVSYTLLNIFYGMLSIIFMVSCLVHIDTIVTGLINPEYGAIQSIIKMMK